MKIAESTFCVTGGAGFIGSRLVSALQREGAPEIRVFDLPGTEERVPPAAQFIGGDLRRPEDVLQAVKGTDGVFHLAVLPLGPCESDPRSCVEVNIGGTLNVLEAVRSSGAKKVVFSSASSVYGDTLEVMEEEHPLGAATFYGASKIAGEYLLRGYRAHHGLDFVALRYMNVYGPGQAGGLIPAVLSRIAQGEPPVIFGDGSQSFDFVHVDDIVQANVRAMASDISGDAFNVGSGTEVTVSELVQKLLKLTGSDLRPAFEPAPPAAMSRRVGSSDKARRLLGYEPSVSLEEGLRTVIEGRAT